MPAAVQPLTLEEFYARYGGEKPYYEYWNGEAVQKPASNWLHSLAQTVMADLLDEAGYYSGVEVELRCDPRWHPIPDVIGALEMEQPYPTRPVDVVVEVISPDDRLDRTLEKCRRYGQLGISATLILDPQLREGWFWNKDRDSLDHVTTLQLPNGKSIPLNQVWQELDRRLQKR